MKKKKKNFQRPSFVIWAFFSCLLLWLFSAYAFSLIFFPFVLFFSTQFYDCRNHVRVIQPMGDGSRLYVCGTNAHNPKDWVINVSIFISYGLALQLYLKMFTYTDGWCTCVMQTSCFRRSSTPRHGRER